MAVKKWFTRPAGISVIYALFASLWIGVTDYVVTFLVSSPELQVNLNFAKGWLFVLVTASLLYILLTAWKRVTKEDVIGSKPVRYSQGLIGSFVLVALLVPLISGGLVWQQAPLVKKTSQDQLRVLAQLQAEQISSWLLERQAGAETLQRDPFLTQALQRWLITQENSELDYAIEDFFKQRMKAFGYDTIEVYLGEKLIKVWGKGQQLAWTENLQLVRQAIDQQSVQQSQLYFDQNQMLHQDWAVPFPAEDMSQAIVLMLHSSPSRVLTKTLGEWPAKPAQVTSLLRLSGDKSTPNLIAVDSQRQEVKLARCENTSWMLLLSSTSRQVLEVEGCDQTRQLIAYSPVGGADWGVVSIMSVHQAYAPLRTLVGWVLVLSSLAVVAMSLMLWTIWRRELASHRHEIAAKSAEKDAMLDYVAHYDKVTGLPNRVLFMTRLSRLVRHAAREKKQLALVLFDLDRFKDINDSYGHMVGDELLAALASRLTDQLNEFDSFARMGGDEFALLIEDVADSATVEIIVTKIAKIINQPVSLTQGAEVRVSVTMGVSIFPEHGSNADSLLQNADAALYRAKADGKGGLAFYNNALTELARERVHQELQLKQAMFKQHLKVFYQPQVDIKTNHIVGAEALIRWQDPERGLISPISFIPIAEETGLIQEIGEWVLNEVCAQGQAWLKQGHPPIRLAVNLSPQQFRHGGVRELVEKALKQTGYPAKYLELELTETALMEEASDVEETLISLRNLGVTLALDDFGTGYSSLSYLKRFALDVIKIDKSFVADLTQEQSGQQIVNAIIDMGHAMGMCVLAEGVESTEQLHYLVQHECDLYQGFLMSKAVCAEDFIQLYQKAYKGHKG